jgi:hypothetical protein
VEGVSTDNFGFLIAYLLPGFVVLWGARPLVPGLDGWFVPPLAQAPTVGGFLYLTVGSTAAGLIVSAVRWAVIDHLYHWTGIPEPRWDFHRLRGHWSAFESLVEDHYRYYQFYANMLVSIVLVAGARFLAGQPLPWGGGGIGQGAALLVLVVLALGSRDSLRKYYRRTESLMLKDSETRLGE